MKQFFRPKEKFSFGLDIGSSAIKLIKLRFLKEKVEFSNFVLEPTSQDPAQALKQIAESEGIKSLNLSVSGPAVIIRYVNFPRMNNQELKQALRFETEKLIPFPLNEVNLDSYILKQDLPDNKMLVLLAAVKLEFIEQRLKLMEAAGLKANIIDIDSLALINAFNFNYSPENSNFKNKGIAILNIGAMITNLNILEDGIPRLSRDINIAGNNFTQRLQDELANLAHEIRTSFDYYESQGASSVVKIFLSGGGSKCSGLKDMLANLIGIEAEYWDPLRQINISHNIDLEKVKDISPQLAVAVGLALRQ